MKRILIAAVVVSISGAALADGYGDFNLGVSAGNRGDFASAAAYLTAALNAPDLPDPLRATAYLARGNAYETAGESDAAEADYTSAIKLKPDDVAAWIGRASLRSDEGRTGDALADYKHALSLQPDNFLLARDVLKLLKRTHDYDTSIALLSIFVSKHAMNPSFLVERARLYFLAGLPDKALADAKKTLTLDPKWAWSHEIMAEASFIKRDFKTAEDEADKAIDEDDKRADFYLLRGYSDWFLNEPRDAARSFEKALERQPGDRNAFLWLNIALTHDGKQLPEDIGTHFADQGNSTWPGRLILLYLGKMQPADVLKQADSDVAHSDVAQCATLFFTAEWYNIHGNASDAAPNFKAAAGSACSDDPLYETISATELAHLPSVPK